MNFTTCFQDLEYKKAGIMRLMQVCGLIHHSMWVGRQSVDGCEWLMMWMQSKMGSVVFHHGAAGLWRRDLLLKVRRFLLVFVPFLSAMTLMALTVSSTGAGGAQL